MSESVRRSGRSRKANSKYQNDGWGKETLRLLRESSDSSNPTSIDTEDETQRSDHEFDVPELHTTSAPLGEAPKLEAEQFSIASGSSKSSQVATPEEDADDDLDPASDEEVTNRIRPSKVIKPEQAHSRGVPLPNRGRSLRGGIWQSMFGSGLDDLKPMLLAKEKWLYTARDVTCPSWKTIEEVSSDHVTQHNMTADTLDLSCELSPEAKSQQDLNRVSFEELQRRQFHIEGHVHKIFLGPSSKQQAYDMPYLTPVSLGQAWIMPKDADKKSYHSGWFVNVGERPQCMAWSRYQDRDQYLALVCRSTPQQRQAVPKTEAKGTPAFTPSAPYPSSIQIWRISANQSATQTRMDHVAPPQLVQILACSFGDIKHMKWAPMTSLDQTETEPLGILTLLTTDGCVRLVYIPSDVSIKDSPACFEVMQAAITIKPPSDRVFTCLTFASPTDLILGTSSGHIHIYNLSHTPASASTLEPYFTHRLQTTYILSLSTSEDEHSHFIACSSAAGGSQLTDLRSPYQDLCTITRARIPTRNLIFNPHTRSFITSIDSSGNTEPRGNAQTTIVAHTLRHFYSTVVLSRFPEGNGTATTLAGSPIHPCIMMGNSSGTVWAQNVVRRIMPTGKPHNKNDAGAWVQKLMEYEWIPQVSNTVQSSATHNAINTATDTAHNPDIHHGPPVRPGTSRLFMGFKPEKLDLSNTGSRKRKSPASGPNGESAILVAFEEEQAVTAMEWNPNPNVAGWCAIGWGSGVVLITDLGHDVT